MVSSSTNICPASTRWDSKISFRSSLPVWVASRDKTVHLCNDKPVMTHHTQSSTIKKLGLDDASTAHDLRNPPAVPCPSVKQWSQAETEVNCERIDTSCDTTATAWLWSLLFDSILVITEEAHPQEDVPCIFIGLLYPSLNGTDDIVQGICPAPWNEVRDLSSGTAENDHNILYHNVCQMIAQSHWNQGLISVDIYCILYTWCHLAIPHHPWSWWNPQTKWPLYASSNASTMLQWGLPSLGHVLL